ncbi:MAG: hypothetical protein KJZ60_01320, partial [Ignavibacteriaceae bacterium]|nr:hypothetical protein [Ignavibacteriaceae bacterium]
SNKAAIGSVVDLDLIKIFEYSDGKLLSVKGNVFPSKEQREKLMQTKLSPDGDGWTSLSFNGEDYITYVLKTYSQDNSCFDKRNGSCLEPLQLF